MDVVGIDPGEDFVDEINRQVAMCDVLIAMIGRDWLTVTDRKGRRRLDDPEDYVRLEIEAALARTNIRVIPILVQGATMPTSEDLPQSLARLARRNALEMTGAGWPDQVARLVRAIQNAASAAPPAEAAAEPAAARTAAPAARAQATPAKAPAKARSKPKTTARPKKAATRSPADEEPHELIVGHFVEAMAFSPIGYVIAAGGDQRVSIWDFDSGTGVAIDYPAMLLHTLAFSPDGALLATAHDDGTARVWDVGTGDPVVTVKRAQRVYGVAFSPDGGLLATALDNQAVVWDLPGGKQRQRLEDGAWVLGVTFPTTRPITSVAPSKSGGVPRLTFAPPGASLVTATTDTATVWDWASGTALRRFGYGDGTTCWGARFSDDARRLGLMTGSDTLRIIDVEAAVPVEDIPGVGATSALSSSALSFGPNGSFAVAWAAGSASVWNAAGEERKLDEGRPVSAVALDPTKPRAATAGEDGVVRVWPL